VKTLVHLVRFVRSRNGCVNSSVTGYMSLGAAVLLGRSIRRTLRAASRALDQVAANTVRVQGQDTDRAIVQSGSAE